MEAIGIVGWKNSGKTTLITRLIPALRARGLSTSTIKHVHHSIDLDQPGKDTFAHREAGAVDVVMYSTSRWAILHELRDAAGVRPDLADVLARLTQVDVVLVEGFKELPMRRIEVRADDHNPPIRKSGDYDIVAVVSDGTRDPEVPTFGRDDIDRLADFMKDAVTLRTLNVAATEA